ncbi:MAG: hypothetical protein CO094_12275 [Anaerolineae bacterium CG_4_9_14_3_um_filter_57_17]|nr:acyltransferase [bacterium]NCT20342.1 acyltransferase [bacterium]OIO84817.1 MAG: hypothetical protein AUK01_08375 [Anaerolineae bacterium CG2_30_57_67]PJB64752.1 MAG: hypothetical protein CO094_12275 [Anaerolineae bacterium CG_4_9_14_3_um_filter_57_17]
MTKIENLTFLRFLAASVVVIYHYGIHEPFAQTLPGFFSSGPIMVSFFFVLSGFVMVIAHYNRQMSLGKYIRARLTRILPAYWIALLLAFVVRGWMGEAPDWTALALSFAALQSWLPPYPFGVNGPGWSLSVEIFFYVVFPFLLIALQQKIISARNFLFAALAAWILSEAILIRLFNSNFYHNYPSISHDLLFFFPLAHFPTFLLGVAGGYLFMEQKTAPMPARWLKWSVLALSVLIVLALNFRAYIAKILGQGIPFDSGFFAPLLLIFISLVAWLPANWLSAPPLALLGEASYAIYIFQYPLKILFDLSPKSFLPDWSLFYIYFFALLLFCVGFHLYVERPLKVWLTQK